MWSTQGDIGKMLCSQIQPSLEEAFAKDADVLEVENGEVTYLGNLSLKAEFLRS